MGEMENDEDTFSIPFHYSKQQQQQQHPVNPQFATSIFFCVGH